MNSTGTIYDDVYWTYIRSATKHTGHTVTLQMSSYKLQRIVVIYIHVTLCDLYPFSYSVLRMGVTGTVGRPFYSVTHSVSHNYILRNDTKSVVIGVRYSSPHE